MRFERLRKRNWHDLLLGGAILTAFVIVAVIGALFALAWNDDRKVDIPPAPSHASQMSE